MNGRREAARLRRTTTSRQETEEGEQRQRRGAAASRRRADPAPTPRVILDARAARLRGAHAASSRAARASRARRPGETAGASRARRSARGGGPRRACRAARTGRARRARVARRGSLVEDADLRLDLVIGRPALSGISEPRHPFLDQAEILVVGARLRRRVKVELELVVLARLHRAGHARRAARAEPRGVRELARAIARLGGPEPRVRVPGRGPGVLEREARGDRLAAPHLERGGRERERLAHVGRLPDGSHLTSGELLEIGERALEHVAIEALTVGAVLLLSVAVLPNGPVAPAGRHLRAAAVRRDPERVRAEAGVLHLVLPEVVSGIDDGPLAGARLDDADPGPDLGGDGRRRLSPVGLDVDHRGHVARAELAHLLHHQVGLRGRILVGAEELICAAQDAGALHRAPVVLEHRIDEAGPVADARIAELEPAPRPHELVLVIGDVRALRSSVQVVERRARALARLPDVLVAGVRRLAVVLTAPGDSHHQRGSTRHHAAPRPSTYRCHWSMINHQDRPGTLRVRVLVQRKWILSARRGISRVESARGLITRPARARPVECSRASSPRRDPRRGSRR